MPREWVLHGYSGFEGLQLRDCEHQDPGTGELRLRIEAFPDVPFVPMLQKNAWFHPYSLFNYVQNAEACARGTTFVHAAIERGELAPQIDRVFAMEDYIEAWHYLSSDRTTYGKVVVDVDKTSNP